MTTVQSFCKTQDRSQRPDCATPLAPEFAVALVLAFGRRLAVIARDQGNGLDLIRIEPAEIAVLD
jgi:hypothetical protein